MSVRLKQRPQLSRAARLRFDPQTESYVLLSPERGLRLNASATEIVQRCTGRLTVQDLVAELLATCATEPALTAAEVTADVMGLLEELSKRKLLEFGPEP